MLYARTTSKDALFLAVYEHGIARLRGGAAVFDDAGRWAGLAPAELVRSAVAELVGISLRHERFLRAVVLVSAVHPEVRRRGSRYSQELGEGFARVVLTAREAITHPDPEAAVRSCFGTVFAALVIRTAYGPGFATAGVGGRRAVRRRAGRDGGALPAGRSRRRRIRRMMEG